MRKEWPDRVGPSPLLIEDGRAEVSENGVGGFRSGSVWLGGTTPKPPAPGVSNYPLRSGRPGSGNHQPISLSARSRAVIVPGVHCAPIVIGYQRYFCLNCRTFRRSLLPTAGYVRIAKLWRCHIGGKTTNSADQRIKTLVFMMVLPIYLDLTQCVFT